MNDWWSSYTSVFFALFIAAIFLYFPSDSNAASCGDLEYRIYGNCTENVCSDVVFIDSELGYGICSRVPVVKDGTSVQKEILEYEVKLNSVSGTGTYELILNRDWYFPEYRVDELRDYIAFYKYTDTQPQRSASAKIEKIPDRTFETLKRRWIAKGISDKRELNKKLFMDSLVLAVALVPLNLSANYFFGWIRSSGRWHNVKIATILHVSVVGYGIFLVQDLRFGFIGAICIILASLLLCLELLTTLGFVVLRRIRSSR